MIRRMKKWNIVRQASASLFSLASKLPVKKKRIVFESFSGKQYSCNPRAIYEYIRAQELDYELVWSVNKVHVQQFKAEGVPYVERLSLKWFFTMARARYWVTNSRMPNWITKPKHTVYVQTWHGTPLKKLVADMADVKMPGISKEEYIRNFHKESAIWDYLVSPNAYATKIFKRAFNFNKTVLEFGYPRNDVLVTRNNLETINSIKQVFQIPLEKKVVLYAPTWRDHHNTGPGSYHFDLQLDIELLKEKLGNDYILLLRLHSFISKKVDVEQYGDFVMDVSAYYDINELYLISDVLITDYSSVFFDYAILNRPFLFFAYDLDEYRDEIRGFYFPLEEEAPGAVVQTTKDLADSILRTGADNDRIDKTFFDRFCALEDGEAAKRVTEAVFSIQERKTL